MSRFWNWFIRPRVVKQDDLIEKYETHIRYLSLEKKELEFENNLLRQMLKNKERKHKRMFRKQTSLLYKP